jgi:hypothetical protein
MSLHYTSLACELFKSELAQASSPGDTALRISVISCAGTGENYEAYVKLPVWQL